jgi:hypothetical protein
MKSRCLFGLRVSLFLWVSAMAGAFSVALMAQQKQAESENVELVGYNDLQGRPAYQPFLHHQGNRWVAYVGLHEGAELNPLTGKIEGNGTMVVDVTDPAKPISLSHIPGNHLTPEKESQAQMVQVCNIAGGTYLIRPADDKRIELWNVTDPARPQFMSTLVEGLKDTHKNWWECDTGVAYLAAWDPKWRRRMTKIFDLKNPAKPIFVRDFGLVGQEPGSTLEEIPRENHGAISYNGKVYFAYGVGRSGIIQITDRAKLVKPDQTPRPENLLAPQIGRLDIPSYLGAHTTYPLINIPIPDYQRDRVGKVRDFLVVTSESTQRCEGPEPIVLFVDITEPSKPLPVSNFQVPASSGNFCDRPGRFGPHSVQESFNPIYYKKLVFVAYFNAGVRVVDVRNPFRPTEVGYYIPAATEKTKPACVFQKKDCQVGIQTNNAEVDDRGWIYIVDRVGTGMHILKLTGPALDVANSP